jgi:F-type H+-transporting ATPase subunit b
MNLVEILGNIGFDWRVALANFVNFLIIFWLLKKFIFGPLGKTLANRKNVIEKGLEDSEKAKTALIMSDQSCKDKIDTAKKEADQIVAEAHKQSKAMAVQSEKEALEVSEKIKKDAEKQILKEKVQMELDVKNQAVDLAFEMTSKILKKEVDSKEDEKFIANLVTENK